MMPNCKLICYLSIIYENGNGDGDAGMDGDGDDLETSCGNRGGEGG